MSFLSVNGTLVVQLFNFAIFFAVLYVVFLRPVAAAIGRRRQYINSLVSDYDRYQADAASLRAQAEEIRAAARREAEHRVASVRAAASNEAAEISTGCSQKAQQTIERAREDVRRELDEARAGEPGAARGLADFMLERVIPEAAA
ncbi:MAG: ATP synthase F0 subunit B [Candidatus Cybelea sp.]